MAFNSHRWQSSPTFLRVNYNNLYGEPTESGISPEGLFFFHTSASLSAT